MFNFRVACYSRNRKPSILSWILLTTIVGLLCQVRHTLAVKCFECRSYAINHVCLRGDDPSDTVKENDCPSDGSGGCMTFEIIYEGRNLFQSGGRYCLTQKYLECFHSATGLDMKEGKCLKTLLEWDTVDKIKKCWNLPNLDEKGNARQDDSDFKGMDFRICTCKGDLCNKIDNWKPKEFEVVKAEKGGFGSSGEGGVNFASQRLQFSTVVIGLALSTLSI